MPRYVVETGPFAGDLNELLTVAEARFPEVTLECRYTLGGEDERDAWVCRATTDHHIRRFADAAGLVLLAIHRIEADVAITGSAARTGEAR